MFGSVRDGAGTPPRERLPRGVVGLLAPNPGPLTLDGTCTWIVAAPGLPGPLVVDPGPALATHRRALEAVLAGRRPGALLLTHGHADHAEAALPWGRRYGAPVLHPGLRGEGPGGGGGVGDGDGAGWWRALADAGVEILRTPGHTGDSVCLLVRAVGSAPAGLLSGDTVLGRGSTVLAEPDGSLADYLASLERLLRALEGPDAVTLLPGHGGARPDAAAEVRRCLTHRQERLDQVREALADGARTPADVVRLVYPDLAPNLHGAALQSAAAQLAYLGVVPEVSG